MTRRILIVFCTMLALALAPQLSAARSYPPKDEGAADASFSAFRTELRRIAAEQDREGLARYTVRETKWSFGGDHGLSGLRSAAERADFWPSLQRVLATPAVRDGDDGFTAPYWHTIAYEPPFDSYEAHFILSGKAPLRKAADYGAETAAHLSFEFVRVLAAPSTQRDAAPFLKVETGTGAKGFVEQSALISVVDYRIGFFKTAQGWRLRFFLAGD